MTRKMVALLLIACGGCGGSAHSTDPAVSSVDFTRFGAYKLWPCGPNSPTQPAPCDGLARKYVATLANIPICDPLADSCVRRPIGGFGPGDAIVCNCTMSVNTRSTQAADAVLTDFYAAGCTVMCCPCPSPPPP